MHDLIDNLQICIKNHIQSHSITQPFNIDSNVQNTLDSEKSKKKRKTESCYKKVTVTTDMISEQARGIDLDDMIYKDNSMPIFESYKKLITSEKGKMVIQVYEENKFLTAVLNDVDAEEGNFKDYDFVITSWISTEVGDYLNKCTCKIYRTLLYCHNSSDPSVTLDSQGTICMHCRFLREDVLPNLNAKSQSALSEKGLFIKNSLAFKCKNRWANIR